MKEEELRGASRDGDQGRVQALLAQGVNPNTQDWLGRSPLMRAAGHGREEVVELLLGQPTIDLEARSDRGRTALLHAAACGHPQVVHLLLARGADTAVVSDSGYTMLMLAARGGVVELVELALNQPNLNLEARNVRGRTALLVAARAGHKQVVLQLLASGANPAVKDNEDKTMLWWAQANGWVDLAAQLFAFPGPVPFNLNPNNCQVM